MRCLATTCFFVTLATALPALSKRDSRVEPPEGCLTVGGEGSYGSINEALDALTSGDACIFVYPGTYDSDEQAYIDYDGLTLYGYTADTGSQQANEVTFTRNINSETAGSLDESAVFNVRGTNFKAYNINFHNTYGEGAQAVAVAANGDLQGYYACGFFGYQDTLYAKSGRQYYSNCYIEGAVDYIFGAAAAWFGECTVFSNGGGYITANSREEAGDTSWYVFDHSSITGLDELEGEVFLGRPWRALARVIYQNSDLGGVVHPEGYTTMADNATPEYREFANTGDGADTSERLYFTTPTNASVTKSELFGSDWESWVDTSF